MTSSLIDAIDCHVRRNASVFSEISSAPLLPSGLRGSSDYGSAASPLLCGATIASLASTVTSLARRVARLETTCVVLEGKWFGSAFGPANVGIGHSEHTDAAAFSQALTNALRPLNQILARHESAIDRIAQHLSTLNTAEQSYVPPAQISLKDDVKPTRNPTPNRNDIVTDIQRLESVAQQLSAHPQSTSPALNHTQPPPRAGAPISSGTSTSGVWSSPRNDTQGFTTTHTVPTTTSSGVDDPGWSPHGASMATDEALRVLWGHRGYATTTDESHGVTTVSHDHDTSVALQDVSNSDIVGRGRWRTATESRRPPMGGIYERVRDILSGGEASDVSVGQ